MRILLALAGGCVYRLGGKERSQGSEVIIHTEFLEIFDYQGKQRCKVSKMMPENHSSISCLEE